MKSLIGVVSAVVAVVVSTATLSTTAKAGPYTSYVSSTGTGTDCSRATPCNTFQKALAATEYYGEIICLDSGDFGAMKIAKSVSIDCSASVNASKEASAFPTGGGIPAAVIIEIADTPSKVRLRGLNLSPAFSNTAGVLIVSAGVVQIENCVVEGLSGGIIDKRTAAGSRLYVKDTVIRNSNRPGITAGSQGVPAITVIDNVSLLNNTYGLAAASGNNVVVTRSTISGNTTAGVHADGGARINITNSVLSNNTTNVNAYGTVALQESSIYFSNVAIQGSGARSLGANRFAGNVSIGATPPLVSGAPADVYD